MILMFTFHFTIIRGFEKWLQIQIKTDDSHLPNKNSTVWLVALHVHDVAVSNFTQAM